MPLTSLNEPQKQAVCTTQGMVLVLAGAGSGKTSVLCHRIAYLVTHKNIPPSHILGLTFTNKAAKEMQHRLAKLMPIHSAKQVTLCTFHSFCMQVLRKEIHRLGFTKSFSLYDEKDVKRLLSHLVRHSLAHEGELPSLQNTLAKITTAKNQGASSLDLEEEDSPPSWYKEFSKDLLERLHICMRSYNAVDFDSLLTLTADLFRAHPDVLEQFQNQYPYILIDEYQDTNPIQFQIAELLAQKHKNLFVVGDDDQSIYGWRGADIQNILNFPAEHIIKLEQNYRSTPTILQASNQVIANNTQRHSKALWSHKPEGSPLLLFHAPNELEEALSIANRIVWYHQEKKIPWKEIAILYRSNILSRTLEQVLSQTAWEESPGVWRKGIPFEVFGGTEFYARAEIKDILAYLRIIANPKDEEALLRIINLPRRGISEKCLDTITKYNRAQEIPLWELLVHLPSHSIYTDLSDKGKKGIALFVELIQNFQSAFAKNSMHQSLTDLITAINYQKAIQEEVKSEQMRIFKWDNVLSCVDALAQYEKEHPSPSLSDFLSTTTLQTNPLQTPKEDAENKVHLMTIHSAKGLEFTVCFLACLEDHIIPHEKSVQEQGIEEERRLMYVAMTRAKQHLILSMAKERKKMGKTIATKPSRFLFEIPKELLQILSYRTIGTE